MVDWMFVKHISIDFMDEYIYIYIYLYNLNPLKL